LGRADDGGPFDVAAVVGSSAAVIVVVPTSLVLAGTVTLSASSRSCRRTPSATAAIATAKE